jgi:hypothetical protein
MTTSNSTVALLVLCCVVGDDVTLIEAPIILGTCRG